MTTTTSNRSLAFLRRAGLLAGVLAIIAGIFGMHIMTGTHSMNGAAAAPGTIMLQVLPGTAQGHTGHSAGQAAAPLASEPAPSFVDPLACATMSAMDVACIPSPGTMSLAAPLPGITPFALPEGSSATIAAADYSFHPGSPSPGELSISRT